MSSAPSPLERAFALHRAGRVEEAAAGYREVIAREPRQADAHHLLGLILLDQGSPAGAEASFTRAVELRPEVPAYHLSRARALRALARTAEAERELGLVLAATPDSADARQLLGNLLKAQRRYAEALPHLREAARLAPQDAVAWLNLGVACLELERAVDAVAAFRRAVELAPQRADAWNILGHALLTFGHASDARGALEQALKLEPAYAAAHDNLGRVARAVGEPAEAVREFRAAVAAHQHAGTQSNLLFALNFDPGLAPAQIAAEHLSWGAAVPAVAASWPTHDFNSARKLRVGFVSADLMHHAVSYFLEPLLRHRPRDAWDAIGYSCSARADAVTLRLRALCDDWVDLAEMDDAAAEARVRSDRIDVLVDLSGHTANNRLLLFARRPAPLQVTWLGYPNTTGLAAIDYRITDGRCDPPGTTEPLHSEKLVRLPHGFSCYLPPVESPPVGPLPAQERGGVTFGCFNQFAKVNGDVIAVWSGILRTLPGARLFLRSPVLADPGTAASVKQRFSARGVEEDQLLLSGERLSVEDHLRAYGRVDVALDPFPYNGATTTCEALWMGVPVVSLAGETHVSRVGVSFLTQVGAADWIARTPEHYLEIAQRLASDLPALARTRATLRERMGRSPLCDGAGFARDFTAALRSIWRQRCAAG